MRTFVQVHNTTEFVFKNLMFSKMKEHQGVGDIL